MDNIPKLFCILPKGVIIKALTYCKLNKKIVACTNDGVYLVDKSGNYKKVVEDKRKYEDDPDLCGFGLAAAYVEKE